LVILSDIEMGAGGLVDDFPQSDFLGELIQSYNRPAYDKIAIDLVFNGDTFDFLKVDYQGTYPRHINQQLALAKAMRVTNAHPKFFSAIRRFLAHQDASRRVFFITGNHDAELAFAGVREHIWDLCDHNPKVKFPGFELRLGQVHIEHGSQHDRLFQVDADNPLVTHNGESILNISWGASALLDTVIPLQDLLYFHDRLRPKRVLLKLMPELKELLLSRMWNYWTREYWKDYFGGSDPTRKFTWTMFKEVAWRFSSKAVETILGDRLEKRLHEQDDIRLFVIGHQHRPRWEAFGDRKLLQSGCFRNEYMIVGEGKDLRAMPKVYVEAWLKEGRPVSSQLVEIPSPKPPEGYLPDSIFDVYPDIVRLLGSADDRKKGSRAQDDQEKKEAKENQ
jgi:UDP-2,3-diacylglucosamine pyrophosphatase LpxH